MKSTVAERGQIVIPKPIRDRFGIRPGQQVEFVEKDGQLVLVKVRAPIDELYGILELGQSTDELLAELRDPQD